MTKQVKDLKRLENSYLNESLTSGQLNRTASQINNASFVSQASHSKLNSNL